MHKTKEEINIARIIYDAYPHADLLPIDPDQDCRSLQRLLSKVAGENIGDGLFKFMVVEVIEGGESTLDGAIRVLEQARTDVETVLQALPGCKCQPEQYGLNFERRLEMHVVVDVTGGQGFLPDEVKDNAVLQQAFAQDIVDRYCGTEYFDPEAIEYCEIPSLWHRIKMWVKTVRFYLKTEESKKVRRR